MRKGLIPAITEEITDWVDKTWTKHQVNLLAFAYNWINNFYESEDTWPSTHRKKSKYTWRKYDYDYKQKSNLFNLDSLYRKIPKKSFIKGRKQELEIYVCIIGFMIWKVMKKDIGRSI